MKRISYIFRLFILAAFVIMTGCKDETWDKGENIQKDGYGTLSFTDLNIEVVNLDAVDSRNVPEPGSFIVDIFRGGNLFMSFPYVSTMPESVSLPAGTYTVKARSGDVLAAAWYAPYFEGQVSVTILEDQVSGVGTVNCKLANIKVTVVIEGKLREMVGDGTYVNVAYRNQDDMSKILTYGLDAIDEAHEGYFEYIPGGETLVAVLHGIIDGEEIRKEFPCVNLLAGQHRVITFSLKESGNTDPDPDDPGEDDPGKDDPGKDDPGEDDPGKDDPGKDDPGKDDPGEDDPGKDDPGEDDPGKDDPGKDDPGKDDPGDDDPGKDDPGNDDPGEDDPKLPEVDETIGSFTLANGLTINVTIKIIDLTYTLQGEDDPVLGGILRPGDPGYTGDEDPSVTNPSYPWGNPDDDEGDDPGNEDSGKDDPEDPNQPENPGQDNPENPDNPKDPNDPDNPDNPDDPTPPVIHTIGFESKYLDIDNVNPADIYGTDPGKKPAVLEIKASAGIAHIHVKIDSPALPPEELNGIGLTSQFDLAYPGDYENGLRGLGFVTGADVIGKTSVNFDVTEFVPLLIILDVPGVHHFYITVVDCQETPLTETIDLRFLTE